MGRRGRRSLRVGHIRGGFSARVRGLHGLRIGRRGRARRRRALIVCNLLTYLGNLTRRNYGNPMSRTVSGVRGRVGRGTRRRGWKNFVVTLGVARDVLAGGPYCATKGGVAIGNLVLRSMNYPRPSTSIFVGG